MFFRERGHLSLQEKGAIIALLYRGVSVNEVAEICGVIQLLLGVGCTGMKKHVERRFGSGRPRKTTPEEDTMLLDAVRGLTNADVFL